MTPNYVFRARARAQLQGNIFSSNWLMALLVIVLSNLIISLASNLLILAWLAEGLLMFGVSHIFLALVRGQRNTVDIGDLFLGTRYAGDLVLLGLLKNLFIMLWTFLFIIPGIVKSYSYSMAYYIKHDHPEYDWKQCIDESRKMMDGHKGRLFCLHFSFIGWILLGMLCCGIGVLWVNPYMSAAEANFYEDLRQHYEPVYQVENA